MTMTYHIPVLLNDSIDYLISYPNGVYVDVTYGGGGHSRAILDRLFPKGRLISIDKDKDAQANAIQDERFTLIHGDFRYLENYLAHLNIEAVDGILADLGVSSHHFDTQERGFSFRFANASLDMRMSQDSTLTAKDVLMTYSQEDLTKLFKVYGEINNAASVAQRIVSGRTYELKTMADLYRVIMPCVPRVNQHKYLSKLMQALRIEVNQEMQALELLLQQSVTCIRPTGRLVIISYHSLEDRMVKRFIKTGNIDGIETKDMYGNLISPFFPMTKAIQASDDEIESNNRARSARMRVAMRLE